MRRHVLGVREPEPLLPTAALASARNRRVMCEPVLSQITGLLERASFELRRAGWSESLGEERLCVKARIPPVAQADGKIDLVALKVRKPDRGRDPQIVVPVLRVER